MLPCLMGVASSKVGGAVGWSNGPDRRSMSPPRLPPLVGGAKGTGQKYGNRLFRYKCKNV